jgi:hypothetical protein
VSQATVLDEAADPGDIGVGRPRAVVADADRVADGGEERRHE